MEEILASIRRIIADDQSLPKHPSIDPAASMAASDISHQPTPPADPLPFPELRPVVAPTAHADSMSSPPVPTPVPAAPDIAPFPSSHPVAPSAPPLGVHEPISPPPFPSPEGPASDDIAARTYAFDAAPLAEPAPIEPAPMAEAAPPPAPEPPPTQDPLESVRSPSLEHDLGHDGSIYDTPIEAPRPESHAAPRSAASLFSETTDSSVSSAFNVLAASRLADNSDDLLNMAREMIRPLLRAWLDDNLPSMVERMVRSEIERVARGGGR